MGVRHLQGALKAAGVEGVVLLDIHSGALENARQAVGGDPRLKTCLVKDYVPGSEKADVCIIASTARDRRPLVDLAAASGCRHLMIEKPLGQSYREVLGLVEYVERLPLTAVVNLNMRMYEAVNKLKCDLAGLPQMQGDKTFTLNTGTLGIGCNGIHLLDMVFYLLNADEARIVAAEVDERLIPSGRGPEFCDFGGWAVVKFYREGKYLGKLLASMAADSTAFGGWEIVAPFARVVIDEIAGTRRTLLRKPDSTLPMNRYGADFEEQPLEKYEAPFLGDLTALWLEGLQRGENLLPRMRESLKAHKLMFDWLSHSQTHKDRFPIT